MLSHWAVQQAAFLLISRNHKWSLKREDLTQAQRKNVEYELKHYRMQTTKTRDNEQRYTQDCHFFSCIWRSICSLLGVLQSHFWTFAEPSRPICLSISAMFSGTYAEFLLLIWWKMLFIYSVSELIKVRIFIDGYADASTSGWCYCFDFNQHLHIQAPETGTARLLLKDRCPYSVSLTLSWFLFPFSLQFVGVQCVGSFKDSLFQEVLVLLRSVCDFLYFRTLFSFLNA